MAFIELQLLNKVRYGLESNPTFLTTKVPLMSGIVASNAERSRPLYEFNAPYGNISQDDHAEIVAAFIACLGGVHSFRFKDWADYQGVAEVIGTAVGGAGETMQLIKTYTMLTQDTVRPIKKPVGQATLYEDGVPLASTTDTTTGIVTFTSSAGKVITADFEFDVPVMFMNDKIQSNYDYWLLHSTDIDLMEDFKA
jgi:uncharacterized protein (TIGR02217 family)